MATSPTWLFDAVGLFDKIIRGLLGMPIFAHLLAVLSFLMVSGLFGWLTYLGIIWTLRSLYRPSAKSAFTHCQQAGGGTACGSRAPSLSWKVLPCR